MTYSDFVLDTVRQPLTSVIIDSFRHKPVQFQSLVSAYKNCRPPTEYEPCLFLLLDNHALFKALIDNDSLSESDVKFLFDRIDADYELMSLLKNHSLMQFIFKSTAISTDALIAKLKRHRVFANALAEADLFRDNFFCGCLSYEQAMRFVDQAQTFVETIGLAMNTQLLVLVLKFQHMSFKALVSRMKKSRDAYNPSALSSLLENHTFFESAIDLGLLTASDVKHMLSRISTLEEIDALSLNFNVLSFALENCLFDSKLLTKLNKRIKNDTFFSIVEDNCVEDSQDTERLHILRLIQVQRTLNAIASSYSSSDQDELFSIIQQSDSAKSQLLYLKNNNLLSSFKTFDQLKEQLSLLKASS